MKLHSCFPKIRKSNEIKLGSLSSSRKPGTGGGRRAVALSKGTRAQFLCAWQPVLEEAAGAGPHTGGDTPVE